jgi:hypothetical protein
MFKKTYFGFYEWLVGLRPPALYFIKTKNDSRLANTPYFIRAD